MKRLVLCNPVFACLLVMLSLLGSRSFALGESDSNLTALFVTYYTALEKGRWSEAFEYLHDRLKAATQVETPEALAHSQAKTKKELIDAFRTFDRLDVVKTEVDLHSVSGHVTAFDAQNVAGQVMYDLLVFLSSPGRPLMYRVALDVGLNGGKIIRMTQHSMVRIDPAGLGDAI